MSQKVIGILGGMGPAATGELFNRIVNNTVAKTDQEHVNMVVINDPQIPDRTKYILGHGPSPIPRLLNNIKKLYYAGAEVVIMPCMTAHSFIDELNNESPIPIVNAVKLLDQHLDSNFPKTEKIGLLATTGSVRSEVYSRFISKNIIVPDYMDQERLMETIYGENGIKAGNVSPEKTNEILRIIDRLREKGIQSVIAGCTELSLVLDENTVNLPILDPVMLLAKEAVRIGNNYSVTTVN
ncbi:amino acid racemase [Evansella sp. LMS18]|uniref:aspartate/glutamate racemase family protein n=1 Tax=Evansella sp. LMS18 TaxID=2924033 RepID=UPI0020D0DAD6|nr:amino acid racemase [Evansella sp. LMS18]UTR11803.1 amino acid racemase [Evansella sp. LMS18]